MGFDGVEVAADGEHAVDGAAGGGDGVVTVGLDGHIGDGGAVAKGFFEVEFVGAGGPVRCVVDESV